MTAERAAETYANRLLVSLGAPERVSLPSQGRGGSETALAGALGALRALAPGVDVSGADVLQERSRHYGFGPASDISAGGATRLLRCADGYVALALAREDDVRLVPALIDAPVSQPWPAVTAWVRRHRGADVRDRAVLLGLACALLGETRAQIPWSMTQKPYRTPPRPRVLDLSALWAGPLCSSLLAHLGCDIVKLEEPARPDGARANAEWFARLYSSETKFAHLADLDRLLPTADVVIEASRPRALRQRGVVAEDFPGVWVSITAYGRDQPDRIGYGDDTAVAGGLVGPGPSFVGDAVADPLTGTHAALAAWSLLSRGRGGLIDIALARTAAAAAVL